MLYLVHQSDAHSEELNPERPTMALQLVRLTKAQLKVLRELNKSPTQRLNVKPTAANLDLLLEMESLKILNIVGWQDDYPAEVCLTLRQICEENVNVTYKSAY